MVKAPPSLANIQALGAARRFRCFLGPRGILTFSSEKNHSLLILILNCYSDFKYNSVTLNFPLELMTVVVVAQNKLEEFIGSGREVA